MTEPKEEPNSPSNPSIKLFWFNLLHMLQLSQRGRHQSVNFLHTCLNLTQLFLNSLFDLHGVVDQAGFLGMLLHRTPSWKGLHLWLKYSIRVLNFQILPFNSFVSKVQWHNEACLWAQNGLDVLTVPLPPTHIEHLQRPTWEQNSSRYTVSGSCSNAQNQVQAKCVMSAPK